MGLKCEDENLTGVASLVVRPRDERSTSYPGSSLGARQLGICHGETMGQGNGDQSRPQSMYRGIAGSGDEIAWGQMGTRL